MPDTRKNGLAYLKHKFGQIPSDPIAVSRFYKPKESWTRKPAWWFDLPISSIKANKGRIYYLVGHEKGSGYMVLKVPCEFLLANLESFETRYQDKIRLHITADGKYRFIEKRGNGNIDFSGFLLS